jgi:hypothetical protein
VPVHRTAALRLGCAAPSDTPWAHAQTGAHALTQKPLIRYRSSSLRYRMPGVPVGFYYVVQLSYPFLPTLACKAAAPARASLENKPFLPSRVSPEPLNNLRLLILSSSSLAEAISWGCAASPSEGADGESLKTRFLLPESMVNVNLHSSIVIAPV